MKEGIAAAKAEKPDLAILDVMLPDGDGFSLMRQIRTWTGIPVIFLTARDEPADKLPGLGLGADDYIAKPFLPQEFLLPLLKEPTRLSRLLRSYAVDLLNAGIPENYSLEMEISKDAETAVIECDARLISRAIGNLVQNSIHHNPQGCTISLRLACPETTVFLTVAYNGDVKQFWHFKPATRIPLGLNSLLMPF